MTTTMTMLALKGVALLALTWLVCLALRRSPAGVRHLLWSAGLAGALSLPVLHVVAPRWELSVPMVVAERRVASLEREAERASTEPVARGRSSEVVRPETAASSDRSTVARPELDPADGVGDRLSAGARTEGGRRSVAATTRAGADPAPMSAVRSSGGPAERTTGTPWGLLIVLVWGAGAALFLGGTIASHLAARRLTREGRVAGAALSFAVASWVERLGIRRPVRVVVHPTAPIPATWGVLRPTLMLPRSHTSWSRETLDHVLLHELAHVRRGDCLWQLVGEAARAVHWPNPLAWIGMQRQRIESERACDDQVLSLGMKASRYAEDLLRIARTAAHLPAGALAMARQSSLRGRLRAILDPRIPRRRTGRLGITAASVATLLTALSVGGLTPVANAEEAPGDPTEVRLAAGSEAPTTGHQAAVEIAAPSAVREDAAGTPASASGPIASPSPQIDLQEWCPVPPGGRRSSSVSIDDDRTSIRWETDGCRLDVDLRGEVEFAADDGGVARMAEGAFLEIEERVEGLRHRARFQGLGGGRFERRFWVDGREQPWDADADAWLAGILPELFRRTSLNAENRTRRFLSEGGPDRVLDEIELMESDHVARTYMERLVDLAELSERETGRLLSVASRGLESDSHLADVLIRVAESQGLAPAYRQQVLDGVRTLDSDHHRRRVLDALLDEPDLTQEQFDDIVRAAADIDSDHHLAEILSRVVREGMLSDRGRSAFLEAMGSIESDFQHRTVLEAFLDAGDLSGAELSQVLAYTRDLDSDSHRAAVLQRVAGEYDLTGAQVGAYLDAVSGIDSDHHKRETAEMIVGRTDFTAEQLGLVLRIADDISSDHHRAGLLAAVIQRRQLSGDEVERVLDVADRIGSDHDHAETLRLIIQDERLGQPQLVSLIRSTEGIGSDREKSTVLLDLARRYELEGAARESYRSAAGDIGSSQIRNEVLAALVR